MSYLLKIATRAWKQKFDGLSEDSRTRLIDSKVLDHTREMNGLNVGSDNIVKAYGGRVTNLDAKGMQDHMTQVIKTEPGFSAIAKSNNMKPKQMAAQTGPHMEASKGSYSVYYGKHPIANKGWGIPDGFSTPGHDDYTKAILHRHEADEVRYSQQARRNPAKSININGTDMPTTTFGNTGHVSPKVIVQESAHAALAPKDVKNTFINARSGGSMESHIISANQPAGGKWQYGNSIHPDMRVGNHVEGLYTDVNKPVMLDTKRNVEAFASKPTLASRASALVGNTKSTLANKASILKERAGSLAKLLRR